MTEIKIRITREELIALAKAKAASSRVNIDELTLRPQTGPGVGIMVEPEWWDYDDTPEGRSEAVNSAADPDAVIVTFRADTAETSFDGCGPMTDTPDESEPDRRRAWGHAYDAEGQRIIGEAMTQVLEEIDRPTMNEMVAAFKEDHGYAPGADELVDISDNAVGLRTFKTEVDPC